MLGDNYFYWDEYFQNPTSLRVNFTNNESISLSESGYEIGTVTRLEKRTVTCVWNCNSTLRDRILEKCMASTCAMHFGAGTAGTFRPRITSMNMAARSEYASRTNGCWTITVVFTEV